MDERHDQAEEPAGGEHPDEITFAGAVTLQPRAWAAANQPEGAPGAE